MKTILIYAPIASQHFLGEKSRQLVRSLLKNEDVDLKIINVLLDNVAYDYVLPEEISSKIIPLPGSADINFDFCISFDYIAHRNGKITNWWVLDADGISSKDDETAVLKNVEGINGIIVYSKSTCDYLVNLFNDNKIELPICIFPDYIPDTSKMQSPPVNLFDSINNPWNFVLDGYWNVEDGLVFGGRNKNNVMFVVQGFIETFIDTENAPGLILNVHSNLPSTVDKYNVEQVLQKTISQYKGHKVPDIYFINDRLTDVEKNFLYNMSIVKCRIDVPQRSNDLSGIVFQKTGKPVIYSNFASQKLYLEFPGNVPVNGNIVTIEGTHVQIIDSFRDSLRLALYDMYYHYDNFSGMCKSVVDELTEENFDNFVRDFIK